MTRKRRTSLRPSIRFEIFKRDDFQCQYCGQKVPDVLLEVDHIVPVSKGGCDDAMNLITSCRNCNIGKGAKELNSAIIPSSSIDIESIQETQLQLSAYYKSIAEQVELLNNAVAFVQQHWINATGQNSTPKASSIRMFIKRQGLQTVINAVDACAARAIYNHCYFYAILHKQWKQGREWWSTPMAISDREGDNG